MKKKIAILTQPLGKNYGGIIQNYALQQVLKSLGHDPVTVNRHKNKEYSDLKILLYDLKMRRNRAFKDTKTYYKNLTSKERTQIYNKNFDFINEYIAVTAKLDSDKHFYQFMSENDYDAVIVGSDQTWRPEYSPNINNYFLDFAEKEPRYRETKKIAYATSFGTSDWEFTEAQTHTAARLAQQFDAVSVREDSGVELCENHLKISAEEVLDPTMLLHEEDYRKLYDHLETKKRSGIFTYVLDQNKEKKMIIDAISLKLNLNVFQNQPKSHVSVNRKNVDEVSYPPLELWLKAFDEADFVITDSFHGTVFSILYNKPFIAIANIQRGASRFTSILKKVGLENRLVYNINDITDALLVDQIDYEIVNAKLELLREDSLNFLKTNLS